MRVLFSTGSPADYMAPPRLAEAQVNCGPAWTDQRGADGRWLSLATPAGEYDLAAVAARLPREQKPDVVVCLVDASWRNLPRNLGAFPCPRVLLVADTHHMNSPLIGMMRYAIAEPFTRRVLLYDRHHAAIFRSAGIKDLHWLPGLTFPHSDAVVDAARRATREARLAFVGQAGSFHPRRGRLLRALAAGGLHVAPQALPQAAALRHYGESLLGFNASLNGDLNLRVFEILAAGAGLLTDRLGAGAGSDRLFTEGQEIVTYADEKELVERAGHWLQHPAEARALGEAGARWFDRHLREVRRRELFRAVAFDGRAAPEFAFSPEESAAVYFGGATDRVVQGVRVYETLQEQHRAQERVRVAVAASVPADVAALGATLPRIDLVRSHDLAATEGADLAVASVGDRTAAPGCRADSVWYWDARAEEFAPQGERQPPEGFARAISGVALFHRRPPGSTAATVPGTAMPGAGRRVLLFTDDPDSGGVAQYNHSLMVGLVAAGYSVACAQSRCENPLVARQRELGIRHHWIPYDTKREFGKTLHDQVNATRIFGEAQPELVIFSDCCPLSNLAAREVARRARLPYGVVVGFVGAYLADRFAPMLDVLQAHYAAAGEVVAVSQENLDLLHRRFRLPAAKGRVIHYGRPERFFAPREAAVRDRLRRELGLVDADVLCFTAARLDAVKGYRHLIEAAQQLATRPEGRRLHFAWAGEGEQRAELEEAIRAAGLQTRIRLLGHRWDVADWYDAADIFALPSSLEGMPLCIMEAMAKGLPVIATAVSGIPEEMGDTGKLLPAAAADQNGLRHQLARTLSTWVQQADVRARVGEAGRRRAQRMFRESLMIERTLQVVRQFLPQPKAGHFAETPAAQSA